jgi:D-alanyl-D-alanine carboxypeptidase/D-alanyl-D-alanine-endopeptidase (penicillin-binding protein 4)
VFELDNRLQPAGPKQVFWTRDQGTYRLLITGSLPPGAAENIRIAVGDPARFAALALRESLLRHGVEVRGAAVARHVYPGEHYAPRPATPLATHQSPTLFEDLRVTDKVSQNLQAEITLRTLGKFEGSDGSLLEGTRL